MAEPRVATLARDAVVVAGPEAQVYMQGQLSQDVSGLAVGASVWSWVLQPTGKVVALVRVTRTGPDTLVADTDRGWGEELLKRLTFFKLRTKVDLTLVPAAVVAHRGPGAPAAAAGQAGGTVVPALWAAGEAAADILVVDPEPAPADAGAAWEAERVAAGVPAMGAELTEKTIPNETGLVPLTVSFTKGCYTGQELVVRIDSRGGNVARHLRGLRSASPLSPGDELSVAGKAVGTVTSAAVSASEGPVALAYVARSVAVGDEVAVAGGTAVVVDRPLAAGG